MLFYESSGFFPSVEVLLPSNSLETLVGIALNHVSNTEIILK